MLYEMQNTPQGPSVSYPEALSENNSLLLDIDPATVETSTVADYAIEHGFQPKDSYHFTIIGDAIGAALQERLEQLPADQRENMIGQINQSISQLGAARLKDDAYHRLVKTFDYGDKPETRESIIQEAEIDGVEDFYATFSSITGLELGTPFPHITLYTKGDGEDSHKGIGIRSAEFFDTLHHQQINI